MTLGLVVGKRFPMSELIYYWAAQCIGGIGGAFALCFIASGKPGFSLAGGLAANGYAEHSPGGYSLMAGFTIEVILTAFFLIIILGATHKNAHAALAPVAIGLGLTLIHLIGIPVTNLSVNPARSLGPAVVVGDWALAQVWLFWVAPLLGASIGGFVYSWLESE